MPRDRWRYGEDDPEDCADWDLYEYQAEVWRRDGRDGRWEMVSDWDAMMDAWQQRNVDRLKWRRSLLSGVCLEGTWGIGGFVTLVPGPALRGIRRHVTVEPDGRYL